MIFFWLGFILLVLVLLAMDLGIFHRKIHRISTREAILWTFFWISLAMLFNVFIYFAYTYHWFGIGLSYYYEQSGKDAAIKFFTGYVIEESLSLDNIFVMALIFNYFKVPDKYQHRVLFWGILGAQIMRGVMIISGIALINKFSWMIYLLGILLIFTAIRMLVAKKESFEPDKNILIRVARKIYPVTNDYDGPKFFSKVGDKKAITPLFLVLLIIESTDVLFAIDSIPAIFAITTDPYIVFTSNIFAILVLRSLYFALASMMDKFRYLKVSLAFILMYVGIKMLLSHSYKIPIFISLGIIAGMLSIGILSSLLASHREKKALISR